MNTKVCTKCKTEYPATNEFFHKSKKWKDGLRSTCKSCRKIERRERYLNNKERESTLSKIWRKNNKERVKETQKNYEIKNKEKRRLRKQEYYIENKDYILNRCNNYRINNINRYRELSRISHKIQRLNISKSYVKSLINKKRKNKITEIPEELYQNYKLTIQLKRELKANNIKIN